MPAVSTSKQNEAIHAWKTLDLPPTDKAKNGESESESNSEVATDEDYFREGHPYNFRT